MKKRIYRAVLVNEVNWERLVERAGDRLVFGNDAAKDEWFGAFLTENGEVLVTVKWDLVDDHAQLMHLLGQIVDSGVAVEIAVEPTGTYSDALVWQYRSAGFSVHRVSPKHTHDFAEIYDGVPSSHDAKCAAMVAQLHLDSHSKTWEAMSELRRQMRVAATRVDWKKQDFQRYLSRLEAKLSRHWPEVTRILTLNSATLLALIGRFGGPAEVVNNRNEAQELIRKVSRGSLAQAKIEAVLTSAEETIGQPLIADEIAILRELGQQLSGLRREVRASERQAERFAEEHELTRQLARYVGRVTAVVLVAILGDFGDYGSVRALVKAFGLNLKIRSSGKHKGQLKITKRGSSEARRWLYLAVLRWIKKDPVARAWYASKVSRSGGVKITGIIALMRKLVAGLFHVARGASFDSGKLFDVKRLSLA